MILQICLMLVQKWQSRSKGMGSSSVALCLKLLNLARSILFSTNHDISSQTYFMSSQAWLHSSTKQEIRSALSSDDRHALHRKKRTTAQDE